MSSMKLAGRSTEILKIAELVAKEQGLNQDSVLDALELALQKPALQKYGEQNSIRVHIDRQTGDIQFLRCLKVVAIIGDIYREILPDNARKIDKNSKIGDVIEEQLPPIEFDRIAAEVSRKLIGQKLLETRRAIHFEEYKNRIGELVTATVKRNEITYIITEFGNRAEGIIKKDDLLPNEKVQVGERIHSVIKEIRSDASGPVIYLSRTRPEFLRELIRKEVNEVYEGLIEIKAIARDPGSRAKVAVYSPDKAIDAVGACIGIKGARVQAISHELMGEKIEVIEWSSDPATFVINSLVPVEIVKVILEDENKVDVVVPEDGLSVAIGKRGQNVKLASALTGLRINVLTEQKESERYAENISQTSQLFIESLNVDEMIGRLLVIEGYTNIQQVAEESLAELGAIQGFNADIAAELKKRAQEFLDEEQKNILEHLKKNKADDGLVNYDSLTMPQKYTLNQNDIKTLQDIADLSSDELIEILSDDPISIEEANKIIMDLRSRFYNLN